MLAPTPPPVVLARPSRAGTFGVAVLLLAVAFGLQWFSGAYQSEFGGEPDEVAHYMNSLCLHDYLAAGLPGGLLAYAGDFYSHYPKLAIGHWPPLFTILQAAWMLVFSPSRLSVLLLMAGLAATTATLLFQFLKSQLGFRPALGGALLFLALPLVQKCSGLVMSEVPMALWCLAATLCWGRYLESERPAAAAAFGFFAALALLTKQTGLALVAVPLVSVLVTGKWFLLRRLSFWLPAVIVAALCGPWYWLAPRLTDLRWSWDVPLGWQFTSVAAPYYLRKCYLAVGAAVLLLALLGLAGKFLRKSNRIASSGWAALLGLLLGVLMVHLTIPVAYEARYLLPALPALVAFAIAGAGPACRWLARRGVPARLAPGLVYGVALLAFALETFTIPRKAWSGYGAVAGWFLTRPATRPTTILIASDARGEGMFISELALREPRPGHTVRRASKALASSTWNGTAYESKFTDLAGLRELLRQTKTGFLVFDASLPAHARRSHHVSLDQVLGPVPPDGFVLEGEFPVLRGGTWYPNAIRIYRVTAT